MYAVYAACKAGMINFTRTMAVELAEYGIRVNAIAPDITATPGLRGLRAGPVPGELPPLPPEQLESVASYVPLGREGVASECAGVAVFLASAMASYITGTCIPVDGGTWASGGWLRTAGGGWSLFGRDRPE
jgi:NAD(P)-dependent dehydrogenase (short-subunit alcohol dehydrogenase family)